MKVWPQVETGELPAQLPSSWVPCTSCQGKLGVTRSQKRQESPSLETLATAAPPVIHCAVTHAWRSEDNMWELAFYLDHVGSRTELRLSGLAANPLPAAPVPAAPVYIVLSNGVHSHLCTATVPAALGNRGTHAVRSLSGSGFDFSAGGHLTSGLASQGQFDAPDTVYCLKKIEV